MLDGKALGSETNPVCVQTLGKNKKGGKGNQTRHGWLKFVLWLGFIFLPK